MCKNSPTLSMGLLADELPPSSADRILMIPRLNDEPICLYVPAESNQITVLDSLSSLSSYNPKKTPSSSAQNQYNNKTEDKQVKEPKTRNRTPHAQKEQTSAKTVIYTDGACLGNPGAGGYCAIVNTTGEREIVVSGGAPDTTNNRMELMAVINGLRSVKVNSTITVVSDSKYVCDAINCGWLKSWKANNWTKKSGGAVLNIDLWKELDSLLKKNKVTFQWVKGHSGCYENERCDTIATQEAKQFTGEY